MRKTGKRILCRKTVLIACGFLLISSLFCCSTVVTSKQYSGRTLSMYRFFQQYSTRMDTIQKDRALENYISELSITKKIGQLFIINLEGSKQFTKKSDYNNSIPPGGYLFFAYNIAPDPGEVIGFTDSIYAYYEDSISPFLCIDHEGGMVNRLRSVTSALPSAMTVSEECSVHEAYELYENAAAQLKILGFSLNLAPVAEPLLAENRDFLQDRSFGSIQKTVEFSRVMIKAFQKNSILCAVKHFPGNSNVDPHTSLPLLSVDDAYFNNNMIVPFEQILGAAKYSCAVLLSHAVVPSVTGTDPSCFSKNLIQGILKDSIGFQGLILTDDIFMGALAHNEFNASEAVINALKAGAHMVMSSQKSFYPIGAVLEKKYGEDNDLRICVNQAVQTVLKSKLTNGVLQYKTTHTVQFPFLPEVRKYNVSNASPPVSKRDRMSLFTVLKQKGERLNAEFF